MPMLNTKHLFEIKKDKEGEIEFIISTEDIDRGLDIMKVSGANLKPFNKNPVIFHQHNSYSYPVAKGIAKKQKLNGKWVITSKPIFSEEEDAQTVKRLVESGFLNAASIGFKGKDWEDTPLPDDLAGQAFTRYMWRPEIRTYKKWDLYEWSFVGIGMNQEALRIKSADALKKELVSQKDLDYLNDYLKQEKAGAVLNNKNKASLNEATELIEQSRGLLDTAEEKIESVLSSSKKPDEPEKNIDNDINYDIDKDYDTSTNEGDEMRPEDLKAMLKEAFDELREDLRKERKEDLTPINEYIDSQKAAELKKTNQAEQEKANEDIKKSIKDTIASKLNTKTEEK